MRGRQSGGEPVTCRKCPTGTISLSKLTRSAPLTASSSSPKSKGAIWFRVIKRHLTLQEGGPIGLLENTNHLTLLLPAPGGGGVEGVLKR